MKTCPFKTKNNKCKLQVKEVAKDLLSWGDEVMMHRPLYIIYEKCMGEDKCPIMKKK